MRICLQFAHCLLAPYYMYSVGDELQICRCCVLLGKPVDGNNLPKSVKVTLTLTSLSLITLSNMQMQKDNRHVATGAMQPSELLVQFA